MILSTLRSYEEDGLLQEITCSEIDFSITMSITETLKYVSLRLFCWFPQPELPPEIKSNFSKKAHQFAQAVKLHATGMSYRNITKNLDVHKSTIFRWLNE